MSTEIEMLNNLLQEALGMAKDAEVTKKLGAAMNLANSLENKDKGILSKFNLTGQVAFVTGGGQGIGRAFCHALGEAGCKVGVADLFVDRAHEVVSELKQKGIEAIAIKVDVSNKADVQAAVKTVVDTFGDLHIGVNNAGIVFHSDSEDTSQTEWDRTMGVNLDGCFFCCQAEAKHMLDKGYGRIINTASMSGRIVNHPQKQVAYNVSKAGVVHMTRTLGAEWAERGVTVNSVSPGYVDTPLNQSESLMALRNIWIRDTPMGRLAEVDDLTGIVVYLASPLSAYMTGNDLVIDGGFSCW